MHQKFSRSIFMGMLSVGIVALAGCTAKINNSQVEQNAPAAVGGESRRGLGFAFSGEPASVEDLVVGQAITVSGTTNGDGSVTALSVRIGAFDPNENFQRFPQPSADGSDQGQDGPRNFAGRNVPEGFNREEFENLSDEERRARFDALRGQGNSPDSDNVAVGDRLRRPSGLTVIQGEIIDRNDTTITVRLVAGGSKLVFYSAGTQIVKRLESE